MKNIISIIKNKIDVSEQKFLEDITKFAKYKNVPRGTFLIYKTYQQTKVTFDKLKFLLLWIGYKQKKKKNEREPRGVT